MKIRLLVIVVLSAMFCSEFCFAQLQIRADQFPTALGDSFTFFETDTAVSVSFDPNANTWDFRTGPLADTAISVFIRKTDAQWGDSFPQSSLCVKDYTYKKRTPNFIFGSKFTDSLIAHGYVFWDTSSSNYLLMRVYPHDMLFRFPLGAGLSWTVVDSIKFRYMGWGVTIHDTLRNIVLKEGTVMTPWGTGACLLMRKSQRGLVWLDTFGIVVDSLRTESADWIVPDADGVVSIESVNYDTTWPITRASSFRRLWRFTRTGIEESEKLKVKSEKLKLEVFPNPATSKANLRFQISDYKSSNLSIFQSPISIKIYDVQGRLVRQIPLTLKTDTEVNWDLRDEEGKKVSAGVYFVRLEIASPSSRNDSAEGKTQTRRVLVIR